MIPYRIKHKATGLYYKPGRPSLSKVGKVYGTNNNVLNYLKNKDILYIIITKRPLAITLDELGYKMKWVRVSPFEACFEIPKSEFEIDYQFDR